MNSNVWKIADFGLTSPGTSSRLVPTEYARGRACYRAPELLRTTNAGYNTKADIWSLGCIIYELYTGRKIFQDDYAVIEYWTSGASLEKVIDLSIGFCDLLLRPMLEICPQARPSARTLLQNIPMMGCRGHPFGESSLAEKTLDWAVSNGDVAIVEAMVENDVDASADYLTIAVQLGNTDLLKALLGNYFPQIFSPGWKALYEATARMDDEMVDILLDGGVEWRDSEIDPDGGTILHLAVAKGNTRIVQLLLNAGLEIGNLADGGRLQYLTAARNEDAEMLQLLEESGCESKEAGEGEIAALWRNAWDKGFYSAKTVHAACPLSYTREGDDWFALLNPTIQEEIDVCLLHTLPLESSYWCALNGLQCGRSLYRSHCRFKRSSI